MSIDSSSFWPGHIAFIWFFVRRRIAPRCTVSKLQGWMLHCQEGAIDADAACRIGLRYHIMIDTEGYRSMKLYRLKHRTMFRSYKHAGMNHGAFSNIPDSWPPHTAFDSLSRVSSWTELSMMPWIMSWLDVENGPRIIANSVIFRRHKLITAWPGYPDQKGNSWRYAVYRLGQCT